MNKVLTCCDDHTVLIEGGITYGELSIKLKEKGYALNNLASLPHISIAGAISTGTHGSGIHHKILASQVHSFLLIKFDG